MANLRFDCAVEPTNAGLKVKSNSSDTCPNTCICQDYLDRCIARRNQNLPTVPSSISQGVLFLFAPCPKLLSEIALNPFMRCGHDPALSQALRSLLLSVKVCCPLHNTHCPIPHFEPSLLNAPLTPVFPSPPQKEERPDLFELTVLDSSAQSEMALIRAVKDAGWPFK